MTDKEFNQQKARVDALIKKWVKPVGMDFWDISYKFHRERDTSEGKDSLDVLFSVHPDWKYLHATINCRLEVVAEVSDEELERAFVHELMHILVNPMSADGKEEQEEYVATTLSKAMILASENVKQNEKKIQKQ